LVASAVLLLQQLPKTIRRAALLDQFACLHIPQVHRGRNLLQKRGSFFSERAFEEIECYRGWELNAEQLQRHDVGGCEVVTDAAVQLP